MRDSEVEQQVLRSLKLAPEIASRDMCVESQDGVVTLSGTSPSYNERSAIHAATRRTPGVRGVVNKIEVEVERFFVAGMSPSANTSTPAFEEMVSTGEAKSKVMMAHL